MHSVSSPGSTESFLSDISSASSARARKLAKAKLAIEQAKFLAEARLAQHAEMREQQRFLEIIEEEEREQGPRASTPTKGEYPDQSAHHQQRSYSSKDPAPQSPLTQWPRPDQPKESTSTRSEYPSKSSIQECDISDIQDVPEETQPDLLSMWMHSTLPGDYDERRSPSVSNLVPFTAPQAPARRPLARSESRPRWPVQKRLAARQRAVAQGRSLDPCPTPTAAPPGWW